VRIVAVLMKDHRLFQGVLDLDKDAAGSAARLLGAELAHVLEDTADNLQSLSDCSVR
jgi:hypothetical protein